MDKTGFSRQALRAVELQSVHILGELDDDKNGSLTLAKAPRLVAFGGNMGETGRKAWKNGKNMEEQGWQQRFA